LVYVFALVGTAAIGSDSAGLGFVAICFSCFLIIPALMFVVYVFVRLSAVVPAIVIENLGPIEAMRRSWRLVHNYWWRTFALLVVLWVMSLVIALGPAAVVTAIVGLATQSFDQIMINAVSGVVTVITAAFFVPLDLTARTLYYFDLRVRKEGFDIESAMAQRYGQTGAPQPGFGGMQTAPVGGYGQAPSVGVSQPILGYQQPADTRYLGGYTPPPGSGYTPPAQGEYRLESYSTEQATTPATPAVPSEPAAPLSPAESATPSGLPAPGFMPNPYIAQSDSQEEQGGSSTHSIFEQTSEPDETPRQG